MNAPSFEWDRAKATANLRKHRVSFDEAMTAFQDPLARIHTDPAGAWVERREILVGHSSTGRLLLVAFTARGSRIRLISARRATRREQRTHEESE